MVFGVSTHVTASGLVMLLSSSTQSHFSGRSGFRNPASSVVASSAIGHRQNPRHTALGADHGSYRLVHRVDGDAERPAVEVVVRVGPVLVAERFGLHQLRGAPVG